MNTPQNRIYGMYAAAGITTIALVILATGVSHQFYALRMIAGLGFVSFAFFCWLNTDTNYWMLLIPAAIFLPFFPFSFERHAWVIIDIVATAWLIYYVHKRTDPYQKGIQFEQYVTTLFPKEDFTIVDRTRDISKFSGRKVESDSHPDFVFRSNKTGKVFAVECKWRARWFDKSGIAGISWDMHKQKKYVQFGKERNMPVFIAFGIGGSPEMPDNVYFVEVERTHYVFLEKRLLESGRTLEEMRGL